MHGNYVNRGRKREIVRKKAAEEKKIRTRDAGE